MSSASLAAETLRLVSALPESMRYGWSTIGHGLARAVFAMASESLPGGVLRAEPETSLARISDEQSHGRRQTRPCYLPKAPFTRVVMGEFPEEDDKAGRTP